MGKMQRTKGAAFEREIAGLIRDHLGIETRRNLSQYQRSGDYDLIGLDNWCIECKRYAAAGYGDKKAWWQQVSQAAAQSGGEPVVIYKLDRQPIRCLVAPFSHLFSNDSYDAVADISLACWFALVRETLED